MSAPGFIHDNTNMWHLHDFLDNYPLVRPNQFQYNGYNKKKIEGWSCNFEAGLCADWKTKAQISKISGYITKHHKFLF